VLPWTGISHFLSFGSASHSRSTRFLGSREEEPFERDSEADLSSVADYEEKAKWGVLDLENENEEGEEEGEEEGGEGEKERERRDLLGALHSSSFSQSGRGRGRGRNSPPHAAAATATPEDVWGVTVVTTSGAELSVHCPTHKIALALCALLKSNLIRLKKPGMSVLH
jgi:hypothetical protein